jgi:hypothetical protein
MRHTIRPIVVILAAFAFATTGAVARMAPTAVAPETTLYRGTDQAGKMTFNVHGLYAGNGDVYLYGLHFADGCGRSGTSVTAHISVAGRRSFHYSAHGVSITGEIDRKVIHSGGATFVSYPKVEGAVLVDTAACDSAVLPFSAAEGKTG